MGIAIADDRVAVAGREGGMQAEPREHHCPRGPGWGDRLLQVLSESAPPSGTTEVTVLVLDPGARARALFGVPLETPAAEVGDMLRRRPGEFFVGEERDLVAGSVAQLGGAWWGSVLDRELVDEVRRAVAAYGSSLAWIAPARGAGDGDPDEQLIETATRALMTRHVPVLGLVQPRAASLRARAATVGLPALLCLAALCAAAFGPTLVFERKSAALEERLRILTSAVGATGPAHEERTLLARARALASEAPAASVVLARVALALPPESHVTMIRLDSTEVELTVMAPSEADVVSALARTAGISFLRLTSAKAHQREADRDYQRISAAFRYRGP